VSSPSVTVRSLVRVSSRGARLPSCALLLAILIWLFLAPSATMIHATTIEIGPVECLGDDDPDQQTGCTSVPVDDKFPGPNPLGTPASQPTCWTQHQNQGMAFFDAYEFEVTATSSWTFVTMPSDFDSILYVFRNSFDPAVPCKTLLAAHDGSLYRGETLEIELEPDEYYLVVSSLADWDDPNDDGKGLFYVKVTVPSGQTFSFTPASYQSTAHSWGYPFCGGQPYVMAVFDHEFARLLFFDSNPVRAYLNDARDECVPPTTNYRTPSQRLCWAYNGHNGWDYKGAYEPVFSVDDGDVVLAGIERGHQITGGWHEVCRRDVRAGVVIQIHHSGENVDSWYAHLSAVYVQEGEAVAAGQLIGLMGRTGQTVSNHLHFIASEPVAQGMWYGVNYPDLAAFDPYGWSPGDGTLDPWPTQKGGAVSQRLILPGANDNATECPSASVACGSQRTVDNSEPCSQYSPDCFQILSGGWGETGEIGIEGDRSHIKGTHYASPSGSKASTGEVSWTFDPVDSNKLYKVEVYVPGRSRLPVGENASRAARYEVHGTGLSVAPSATIDQWEYRSNGARGRWIAIGWYKFTTGVADIRLSNAAYYAHPNPDLEYIEGLCVPSIKIYADKVRITPECGWQDYPGGGVPGPNTGGGGA